MRHRPFWNHLRCGYFCLLISFSPFLARTYGGINQKTEGKGKDRFTTHAHIKTPTQLHNQGCQMLDVINCIVAVSALQMASVGQALNFSVGVHALFLPFLQVMVRIKKYLTMPL